MASALAYVVRACLCAWDLACGGGGGGGAGLLGFGGGDDGDDDDDKDDDTCAAAAGGTLTEPVTQHPCKPSSQVPLACPLAWVGRSVLHM